MGEAALVLNSARDKDPTRTLTLRKKWVADMNRRFRALKKDINTAVVKMDVLGLNDKVTANLLPEKAKFEFRRDADKIGEFMTWLNEAERAGVLEVVQTGTGEEPWTNTYVRSAYQRGLNDASVMLKAKGIEIGGITTRGFGEAAGAFYQPFHSDRVQLLYRRTFTDLEGVTATMNTQISRVLAQGMVEGIGPIEMAKRINDRVNKIGMTRARLIARTETTETYNRAALGEYERAEALIGEEIKVRWWTAQDERVRAQHAAWHNQVMTRKVAATRIGSPNCRCSLLAVVEE